MEFKGEDHVVTVGGGDVDIGTEWNLKLPSTTISFLAKEVDIGTEWNLKVLELKLQD